MIRYCVEAGFVITEEGLVLVQLPDDNRWGFILTDGEQSWEGGFGIARAWDLVPAGDPRITPGDHRELDYLLVERWA